MDRSRDLVDEAIDRTPDFAAQLMAPIHALVDEQKRRAVKRVISAVDRAFAKANAAVAQAFAPAPEIDEVLVERRREERPTTGERGYILPKPKPKRRRSRARKANPIPPPAKPRRKGRSRRAPRVARARAPEVKAEEPPAAPPVHAEEQVVDGKGEVTPAFQETLGVPWLPEPTPEPPTPRERSTAKLRASRDRSVASAEARARAHVPTPASAPAADPDLARQAGALAQLEREHAARISRDLRGIAKKRTQDRIERETKARTSRGGAKEGETPIRPIDQRVKKVNQPAAGTAGQVGVTAFLPVKVSGCGSCVPCVTKSGACTLGQGVDPTAPPPPAPEQLRGGKELVDSEVGTTRDRLRKFAAAVSARDVPDPQAHAEAIDMLGYVPCRRDNCRLGVDVHPEHADD